MWVNMKRLAVIQDRLCYALFYVLDLCTLYKKQAERGSFFDMYVCMYVCMRHDKKYTEVFFSTRSTQFHFKLHMLFKKKIEQPLEPKILRKFVSQDP